MTHSPQVHIAMITRSQKSLEKSRAAKASYVHSVQAESTLLIYLFIQTNQLVIGLVLEVTDPRR